MKILERSPSDSGFRVLGLGFLDLVSGLSLEPWALKRAGPFWEALPGEIGGPFESFFKVIQTGGSLRPPRGSRGDPYCAVLTTA